MRESTDFLLTQIIRHLNLHRKRAQIRPEQRKESS